MIVTGRGRGFCAGADLWSGPAHVRRRGPRGAAGWTRRARDGGGQLTLRIYECTKPVIAAMNGPAVGIGMTMTLAMDIRWRRTTRMGFVFARRGLVPEAASSWFLTRAVPVSAGARVGVLGRVFPASEALDAGLVRSLHPKDQFLAAARAIATECAENTSAISVAVAPAMLWRMLGADHPMEAHKLDSRAIRRSARARTRTRGSLLPREARA